MATCFVMQPFDRGAFDRRFSEVFKPAIERAGLEAYRVDQDPSTSVPITSIENGIRDAQICLADITHDNPNVWFELGFAIACNRPVVMVFSDERQSEKFPFDVQHRSIIKYATKSPSDFGELGQAIEAKILAYLKKSDTLSLVANAPVLKDVSGLDPSDMVAMVAITENMEHPEDYAVTAQIFRDMDAHGFTKLAATLSLRRLVSFSLVEGGWRQGYEDNHYGYNLTEKGWQWMVENKEQFSLRRKPPPAKRPSKTGFDDMDDIPF